MNIELYPQCQLFKFTILLNYNKEYFIRPEIESRAVNGTVINRAYYSAYSYALLWLEETEKFKPKQKWEFEEKGEKYVSEHQQVRNALKDHNKIKASRKLKDLHDLRKKADYKLSDPLTKNDLDESIEYMNVIFDELKFN
ncbi:hypothetical protein [Methanobrevibacter sp.]|uniref:hypothetical protein n=1 Tax=Methanobrevibacter sp. TaxID=66852 RepID=UPI0025CC2B08|nr:hypothetical protein [Methanobrevibacter sp.]MBQ2962193.1 hypothetical protein [Methanobrevibacter sp.]